MSGWEIVLDDGSRHPVSGEIRFEMKGGSKLVKRSTIDGATQALSDAWTTASVVRLAHRLGSQYRVSIGLNAGRWEVVSAR